MSSLSLFIPRVFASITKEDMKQVFHTLDIGMVNRVDFVVKMGKDKKIYHTAYVHFDHWYSNVANDHIREKLERGEEARIVYNDPWYWIVYKNKTKKFGGNGMRKERLQIVKEEKTLPVDLDKDLIETFYDLEAGISVPSSPSLLNQNQEFNEEEERNLLQEFNVDVWKPEELEEIERNLPEESFEYVDARYVAMLEEKIAYFHAYFQSTLAQ